MTQVGKVLVGRLAEFFNGKHQLIEGWVALLLTVGEFTIAAFLLIHDGHVLAGYLAVTYLLRETEGGKRYHELVIKAVKRSKGAT